MRTSPGSTLPMILVLTAAATCWARELDVEVGMGLGYAQLDLSGETELDGAGGAGGWVGVSFSPIAELEAFRLGLNLGFSYYEQDRRLPFDPEPELFDLVGTFEELALVTPELRLGWRQSADRFFIEPGVGLNLVVGTYVTGETRLGLFGRFDHETSRRTRAGWGVRPGVRAGYQLDRWQFGIEGSYLIGHVRLGNDLGSSFREWLAGGFITFRF